MKGYFIDASARAITAVEYEYGTLARFLPGGLDIGWRFPNGDVLYVEDDALLRKATVAFRVRARPDGQPMMSNGFLQGRDDPDPFSNTALPPSFAIEALQAEIEWLDRETALDWFRARAKEPATTSTKRGITTIHARWQGYLDNLEGRKGYDPRKDESLFR